MEAACWAHVRRKFYDIEKADRSPIAAEAVRRIGELYEIEAVIARAGQDGLGRTLATLAQMTALVHDCSHRQQIRGLESWQS